MITRTTKTIYTAKGCAEMYGLFYTANGRLHSAFNSREAAELYQESWSAQAVLAVQPITLEAK